MAEVWTPGCDWIVVPVSDPTQCVAVLNPSDAASTIAYADAHGGLKLPLYLMPHLYFRAPTGEFQRKKVPGYTTLLELDTLAEQLRIVVSTMMDKTSAVISRVIMVQGELRYALDRPPTRANFACIAPSKLALLIARLQKMRTLSERGKEMAEILVQIADLHQDLEYVD